MSKTDAQSKVDLHLYLKVIRHNQLIHDLFRGKDPTVENTIREKCA